MLGVVEGVADTAEVGLAAAALGVVEGVAVAVATALDVGTECEGVALAVAPTLNDALGDAEGVVEADAEGVGDGLGAQASSENPAIDSGKGENAPRWKRRRLEDSPCALGCSASYTATAMLSS